MNLRHLAQDIGRGARPAADVQSLDTLVDRKLVLMWAHNQAIQSLEARRTLEEIQVELTQLELMQDATAAMSR